MLQWVSSSLPWEKLKNKSDVEAQKNEKMQDCDKFVKNCVKDPEAAGKISMKLFVMVDPTEF